MKVKMVCLLALGCCLMVGSGITFGDEEAITLSGKRVILHEDGKWEYVKILDVNEAKFRDINWGVPPEVIRQAIALEPIVDTNDLIIYRDRVGNLEAELVFSLVNNCYVRAGYMFTEDHSNRNLFLKDYECIGELLETKYGKPFMKDVNWRDDLYVDDESEYGFAVSKGDLQFATMWSIGSMRISHMLSGDNFDIRHNVLYSTEDTQKLERAFRNEDDTSKL